MEFRPSYPCCVYLFTFRHTFLFHVFGYFLFPSFLFFIFTFYWLQSHFTNQPLLYYLYSLSKLRISLYFRRDLETDWIILLTVSTHRNYCLGSLLFFPLSLSLKRYPYVLVINAYLLLLIYMCMYATICHHAIRIHLLLIHLFIYSVVW